MAQTHRPQDDEQVVSLTPPSSSHSYQEGFRHCEKDICQWLEYYDAIGASHAIAPSRAESSRHLRSILIHGMTCSDRVCAYSATKLMAKMVFNAHKHEYGQHSLSPSSSTLPPSDRSSPYAGLPNLTPSHWSVQTILEVLISHAIGDHPAYPPQLIVGLLSQLHRLYVAPVTSEIESNETNALAEIDHGLQLDYIRQVLPRIINIVQYAYDWKPAELANPPANDALQQVTNARIETQRMRV